LRTLFERDRTLMDRASRSPQDEHAMPGQQSHRGVAHLSNRSSRAVAVVDRTVVFVDQRQRATAKR